MIKAVSLEPKRYDRRVKATNFLKEMDIINQNRIPQIHEIDSLNQFYNSCNQQSILPPVLDDGPYRSPSGNVLMPAINSRGYPNLPVSNKQYKKRKHPAKLDLDLTNLRVLD